MKIQIKEAKIQLDS